MKDYADTESGELQNKDAIVNSSPPLPDTEESPPGILGSSVNRPNNWNRCFWSNPNHVGICFASEKALDAAIDWLWTAPELRELPRVHVGENTMIVPAQSVEFFRQRGLQFTLCPVVSAGVLPTEEVNRIRREG